MISIPIPPREPRLSPTERLVNRFREIATFRRDDPSCDSRELFLRRQAIQKRRAISISAGINLLVFLILYLIVAPNPLDNIGMDEPMAVLTVVPSEMKDLSDSSSSSSANAATPNPSRSEVPKQAEIKSVQVIASTSMAPVPEIQTSALQLNSFDLASPMAGTSFSPSMSRAELRGPSTLRPSRQRGDPFSNSKTNGKKTGGGGNGNGGAHLDNAGGFFQGAIKGDGSNLLLVIDISGSMDKHSRAVARFVEFNYPKASIVEAPGCAIHSKSPVLLKAIGSTAEFEKRTQVVFVCDLRDAVDIPGIRAVDDFLLDHPIPKSLHIISYDRPPGLHLRNLIERSGGSFKWM